jgi:hypothetical protein
MWYGKDALLAIFLENRKSNIYKIMDEVAMGDETKRLQIRNGG